MLLDSRIRARLDLNDEQVKKIQEIKEKGGDSIWVTTNLFESINVKYKQTDARPDVFLYSTAAANGSNASRTELLKVLTPQQIAALEKLGLKFEKGK